MPKILSRTVIPEEAPPDLEWTQGNISVRCAGYKSQYVDAVICGPLAIHACLLDDNLWTVSHRRIGYRFCDFTEDTDAVKVAEFLMTDSMTSEALKEPTWQKLFGAMPVWVSYWRKDMEKEKKWIDPKPYTREVESKQLVKSDPFMTRWLAAKTRHPKDRDGILLLNLAGRYECYGEDAAEAARVWRMELKTRSLMAMVGFVEAELEERTKQLKKAGYKVYVAEKS